MSSSNGERNIFLLPHWKYPVRLPGLTGLYLNSVLRTFSLGLIGIFVPVFIYQVGGGLPGLLKFYLICEAAVFIFSIPTAILIKKWGPDWLIALATILLIGALFFLISAQKNPVFLWPAAVFWGIAISFHWIPYHLAFSEESQHHLVHQQIANRNILNRLAATIAPLLGGVIAARFGFSLLYLAGIVFIFFSLIPIFLDQYNRKGREVSLKRMKKVWLNPKFASSWRGFWGMGLETAIYTIFLPVFIYQALGNWEKMGLLSAFSLLFSLLAIAIIGQKTTKNEQKVFFSGIIFSLPFWLIINSFSSFGSLVLISSAYNISSQAVWIPIEGVVYRQGREGGKLYFVFRNFALRLGIISALLAAGLIYFLNLNWSLILKGGAVGLLVVVNFCQNFKKPK